jgi:hypothetical protein
MSGSDLGFVIVSRRSLVSIMCERSSYTVYCRFSLLLRHYEVGVKNSSDITVAELVAQSHIVFKSVLVNVIL